MKTKENKIKLQFMVTYAIMENDSLKGEKIWILLKEQ